MTNARLISCLLFVSALILGFSGCKKEEEPNASFKITGEKNLHFEYGQTKEVSFTTQQVQSFKQPVVTPRGWECKVSGSKLIITSPAEDDTTASLKGEIEVIANTNAGATLSNVITIAVKLADKISIPANSYIVSEPDKRYKFDARLKGTQTEATLSPVSAKLLWTTVDGAVSNVSLEDNHLYFATKSGTALTNANALVAALDKAGNVVWSWHIWCTDYDFDANTDELEGLKIMDRNLGAFASSNSSDTDVLNSYGLYYQWGRKDPFAGPSAWNSSVQLRLYDADGASVYHEYEATTAKIGTIDYAVANPLTFITGVKDSEYDWLFGSRDNSMWGNANSASGVAAGNGTKSVYDPCPAGWMVAPPKIWKSFTKDGAASTSEADFNVEDDYKNGWTFTDNAVGEEATSIYYPAAGRRSFGFPNSEGNFVNVVNGPFGEKGDPVGFYWSNSNSSATDGALLAFRKDYINPDSSDHADKTPGQTEGARAGGFPLRCAKIQD